MLKLPIYPNKIMNMKYEDIIIKQIEKNTKVYNDNKELLTMYEEYINNIVEFFDFIRKDESDFFYTIVFDILTEFGFFSADRKYNKNSEIINELMIKQGISVVSGAGECRNIACFYQDVFSYFYNYPLLFCGLSPSGMQGKDELKYGNHVINLTKHNGIMYGFDLTNHCAYKPISDDKINGLFFDYPLLFTPQGNILLGLSSMLDKNKDLLLERSQIEKFLKETQNENYMTKEDFDKIVLDANHFIIKSKKLIQSFITQNDELTHEIKKKMLLLK